MKNLIGETIKGFKFESKDYPDIGWESPEMDACINVWGRIESYDEELEAYTVYFSNELEAWDYPAKLVEERYERNS